MMRERRTTRDVYATPRDDKEFRCRDALRYAMR